jgi:hypothetical protein
MGYSPFDAGLTLVAGSLMLVNRWILINSIASIVGKKYMQNSGNN